MIPCPECNKQFLDEIGTYYNCLDESHVCSKFCQSRRNRHIMADRENKLIETLKEERGKSES